MAAWPSTSSGLVGSSIQSGLNSASAPTHSIASGTSQTWLASIMRLASQPDDLAGDAEPADVVVEVGADLQLDVAVAGVDGLLAEAPQLVVAVAEPSGARRVAGVAAARVELGDRAAARVGSSSVSMRDRLVTGDRVGEVAQVGGIDELLRRHVDEQPPERLAGDASGEVPDGVHDRGEREVHDALLRPEPAQLRVALQLAVDGAEVADELVDVAADQGQRALPRRLDAEVVAAPDREGEAEARQRRGRRSSSMT